jgi:CHAD domain-containing protein
MRSPHPHSAAAKPPAASSIIDAIVDRLSDTRSLVCHRPTMEETAVHEARKALKNIRAGLRLLSDAGDVDLRQAGLLCRDVGRLLSGLRDTDVCLMTLESFPESLAAAAEPLKEKLRARRAELHESAAPDAGARQEIAADLDGVEKALRGLDPTQFTDAGLHRAAESSRETGEKRYRKLIEAPAPERFHDVRKASKRELYQRRYLEAVRGGTDMRIGLLEDLSEHLGLHQDLWVLREVAAELGELRGELADAIDRAIGQEQEQSLAIAAHVYGLRK